MHRQYTKNNRTDTEYSNVINIGNKHNTIEDKNK
jgi:hypothetical protein